MHSTQTLIKIYNRAVNSGGGFFINYIIQLGEGGGCHCPRHDAMAQGSGQRGVTEGRERSKR